MSLERIKYHTVSNAYSLKKKLNLSLTDTGKKQPFTFKDYVENKIPPMWYNVVDYDKVKLKIKDIISDIIYHNDEEIIGFKDLLRDDDDNISILKNFITLFPDTKIIINFREDIKSQSKSKWYMADPNSIHYLETMNKHCIDLYNNFKENCYLMEFNDIFNVNKVKEMFNFLGKELNEEEYSSIINNKIDF
jgi:hypothetical protein